MAAGTGDEGERMAGSDELTARRREVLRALCDTYAPAVEPPAVEADDPTGFWARTASDLDVDAAVGAFVLEEMEEDDRAGMLRLLDLLALTGFHRLPSPAREATVKALRRLSPAIADGLAAFRTLTLVEFYGGTGPDGTNPNWAQLGYPGPPEIVDADPQPFPTFTPPAGEVVELDADVVVVGSGSGGGVVAGELSAAGLDVVVLEAGPALAEADFPPDELTALRGLYWRAVPATEDGNVTLMAGQVLGGGSTVNWTNCVPPPAHVREQWAREHGMAGLDGAAFDEHLQAVLERISATPDASDLNGPNERLRAGAEALGWSWHRTRRNTDLDRYSPETAGHMGFGDRTGSKQGTLKTYLRDAVEAGARVITDCWVERLTIEGGHARGVDAIITDRDRRRRRLTVRAPRVVVACGALETPALLIRSGLGGPAVGRHLRVHPVPNVAGFYPEPTRGWWGAPQTVIVDELGAAFDGHGFLVETPHLHIAISGAAVPWIGGRDHKLLMGRGSNLATFIAVTRERGSGRVTVDGDGQALVTYPIDDRFDRELLGRAVDGLVRLHVAAGAEAIVDLHPDRPLWRRGEDVDGFIDRLLGLGWGKGGRTLFSAHQMGTARAGTDPQSSVADPDGQLHDTSGVWIGDTSLFPTAVGSNPMVTCMALARRTAQAIAATGR